MNIYMRIYKYSMRFRVPALDQSDCSICYNYDLSVLSMNGEKGLLAAASAVPSTLSQLRQIIDTLAWPSNAYDC